MMKRIIAVVLAVVLCMGCACAEGMGAELTQVTLIVKDALGIGDQYTDFSSSNYDEHWDLYWSCDTEELSVHCDADGKIYNYYLYEYDYTYDGDFSPRYPDMDVAELRSIADEFLARVITDENEGWQLEEITSTLREGNSSRISIEGRLTMMDVPTDITVSLIIDGSSGRVVSFYRSDNYMEYSEFTGDTSTAITDDAARDMLYHANSMELVYQITGDDGVAKLVYKPMNTGNFAVRASDGQLLDVSENYGQVYASAEDAGVAGGFGGNRELTEAELEGISVYENAMTATQLDEKLRAMPELGITADYEISAVNYYENGKYLVAYVGYTRALTEDELAQRGLSEECSDEKSFTVSAEDGMLMNMYSYYPGARNEKIEYDEDTLTAAADSFIANYYPEYSDNVFVESTVYHEYSYNWERSLSVNYTRTHNGYPFRKNSISVEVNAETGTIDGLNVYWDEDQEFDEPADDAIISAENAYDVYLGGFEFEKAFVSVPGIKISDWEYQYDLTYVWHYRDVNFCYGVDAVTGEALTNSNSLEGFVYSDISGHMYEAEISKLGEYGIGFSGGSFEPDAPFTAKDALVFIGQAPQYNDSVSIEARDYSGLVSLVHNLGANGLEAYAEDQQLSRLDFARMLVGLSGYEKALALPGIYACGFADDDEISEADYPAIAIAYALGLIETDADGNINAYAPLTRAEGALIFHNLLSIK